MGIFMEDAVQNKRSNSSGQAPLKESDLQRCVDSLQCIVCDLLIENERLRQKLAGEQMRAVCCPRAISSSSWKNPLIHPESWCIHAFPRRRTLQAFSCCFHSCHRLSFGVGSTGFVHNAVVRRTHPAAPRRPGDWNAGAASQRAGNASHHIANPQLQYREGLSRD